MSNWLQELVNAIKKQNSENVNLADSVKEILSISKETAYRRIKGESEFTLDEIAKLAQVFNISLDSLIKEKSSDTSPDVTRVFNSNKKDDFIDNHCLSLEKMISCVKGIKEGTNPVIFSTSTTLLTHPYAYEYEYMTKFRLYRFLYSQSESFEYKKFSDIVVPNKIIELEQILYNELLPVNINIICVKDYLHAYKLNIKHLYDLEILSNEDVEIMKEEQYSFFDKLNNDLMSGKNTQGAFIKFFVSDISFASNCIYFSNDSYDTMIMPLFGNKLYSFNDKNSINNMKKWLNNLIKSSILISLSGEKQRLEFILKQKEIISSY